MHLINLIVNYLYRKYRVPLYIFFFFENWTRGTSYLKRRPNIEVLGKCALQYLVCVILIMKEAVAGQMYIDLYNLAIFISIIHVPRYDAQKRTLLIYIMNIF